MREWLKELREALNMSQMKLAEIVGISQQQYSFIETGERNPSVSVAKKIAAALGFDWQKFYEDVT